MSVTKGRILEHMNVDHRVSLFDYLAYYGGIRLDILNPRHNVELVDVALDHLVVNYNKNGIPKTVKLPLNPPLKSLDESRQRFMAMAFEAADGMHVSPYRVLTARWPTTPLATFLYVFMPLSIITGLAPKATSELLAKKFPSLSLFIAKHARNIMVGTFITHIVEYFLGIHKKMAFFRVPKLVKWKWFLITFYLGYPALKEFEEETARFKANRAEFEAQSKRTS